MKNIIKFIVKVNENDQRVDLFLSNNKKELSRTRVKNLILNTTEEMKIISSFIGIDFEKILSEPTHFKKKITFKDNHNVIDKEKNSAINTFSKYQISLLNQFEKKFPLYNFLSFSFLKSGIIFLKSNSTLEILLIIILGISFKDLYKSILKNDTKNKAIEEKRIKTEP